MRSLLPFIALALMLPLMLCAQQQDIRISPEPVSYALPEDIRIESAERIGTTTLVVWGSTRFADDSAVVNALYVQMIDGNNPVGQPRLLHTTEARPSGFVRALALNGEFLVLWNDLRAGAPGLYIQRVKLDGTNSGPEERYATGRVATMAPTEFYKLDLDDGGLRLLWNDTRADSPGVYTLRINPDGSRSQPAERAGDGRIVRELQYDSLPGVHVLLRDKHPALIAYTTGIIDRRPVPPQRFQLPFYLNADTSFAEIESGEVRFYRSVFDSYPYKSIRIAALDSAIATTTVLTRDSIGQYQVVYAVTTATGRYPPLDLEQGWFTLGIYALTLLSDDSTPVQQLFFRRDLRGYFSTSSMSYTSYESGRWLFGCSNTFHVKHVLKILVESGSDYSSTRYDTVRYSVNQRGGVAIQSDTNFSQSKTHRLRRWSCAVGYAGYYD